MYDSVAEAVEQEGANVSLIFVPAAFATDALLEAAEGGVDLIVCITDGLPTLDMAQVAQYLTKKGVRLIGPNCPGLTSVAEKQKGRHHPRQYPRGGTHRRRLPLRHADL